MRNVGHKIYLSNSDNFVNIIKCVTLQLTLLLSLHPSHRSNNTLKMSYFSYQNLKKIIVIGIPRVNGKTNSALSEYLIPGPTHTLFNNI